ncbi:hypothetical protein [Methyloversatilis sp. XJ19-49]|uniref:hypothetical protein n=1 Tax=Methyloversatilis sp. XJ19-49 TaxID=2963429 RepID=UPI00211CB67B|nr:hypothetical protein [Methyloversatilis sp. XJ19-49]MCQ9378067.1 hypothetical protein [Methyloversatilis sp. XJ19-49]
MYGKQREWKAFRAATQTAEGDASGMIRAAARHAYSPYPGGLQLAFFPRRPSGHDERPTRAPLWLMQRK